MDGLQNQVEDHMDVAYGAVLEKDGTLFFQHVAFEVGDGAHVRS